MAPTCQFRTRCLPSDTTRSNRHPAARNHARIRRPGSAPLPAAAALRAGLLRNRTPSTHLRLNGHRNPWARRGRDQDTGRESRTRLNVAAAARAQQPPAAQETWKLGVRRVRGARGWGAASGARDRRAPRRPSHSAATARAKPRPGPPAFLLRSPCGSREGVWSSTNARGRPRPTAGVRLSPAGQRRKSRPARAARGCPHRAPASRSHFISQLPPRGRLLVATASGERAPS